MANLEWRKSFDEAQSDLNALAEKKRVEGSNVRREDGKVKNHTSCLNCVIIVCLTSFVTHGWDI